MTVDFLDRFSAKKSDRGGGVRRARLVSLSIGIAFFRLFGLSFIWIIPCSLLSGVAGAVLICLLCGRSKKAL